MRCDAGSEIEGDAVEVIALARRTDSAALLEAGNVRVAIVPTARTLREVASKRCNMPYLRRCESFGRRGQTRIGRVECRVGRDRRDTGERTDPGRAARVPRNVRDAGGTHQVDQGSARYAAAPPLRKVGPCGAEFGPLCGRRC